MMADPGVMIRGALMLLRFVPSWLHGSPHPRSLQPAIFAFWFTGR